MIRRFKLGFNAVAGILIVVATVFPTFQQKTVPLRRK
jgi:hypothetical protein